MYFDTVTADTPERMEQVYRLRYQVYCVENNFLEAEHYRDGLEVDECDRHSQHALLLHRSTGAVVGTTRLVLPKFGRVSGQLPIFKICPQAAALLPADRSVEASRFAISKDFRRRVADESYGREYSDEELASDPRRVIPNISLGLIAASVRMAILNDSEFFCAVMEPALLRLLARFGLKFEPLGPVIDYHGKRQPCYAETDQLLAGIEDERYDLWEMITERGRHRRHSTPQPVVAGAAV